MAVEDSLTGREEYSLMAESVITEAVSVLWIVLSGARKGYAYEKRERARVLYKRDGQKSSRVGKINDVTGWVPLSGVREGLLIDTNEGGGEGGSGEASAEVCLCVCEAFTSITLAVTFWFPS